MLSQYESVLTILEEMAATGSSTAARVNGLHERFEKGKTVLGVLLVLEVIEKLECLNKSLQKQIVTIAEMRSSMNSTVETK